MKIFPKKKSEVDSSNITKEIFEEAWKAIAEKREIKDAMEDTSKDDRDIDTITEPRTIITTTTKQTKLKRRLRKSSGTP